MYVKSEKNLHIHKKENLNANQIKRLTSKIYNGYV